MGIRQIARFFFILLLLTAVAVAQEPVKPKLTPAIITATRQVSLFTGMERQVLTAIQKKDKAGVQSLLGDDFEIAMPDADPLPGDDWLDIVTGNEFTLKSFIVRQLSVADLGDSAVVKFERVQQAAYKGRSENGEFFVVDLWKKSGDTWKLANRYVSRVSAIPGNANVQPRPSGKE